VLTRLRQHLLMWNSERSNAFTFGEAQKTQEYRAMCLGKENVLESMISVFTNGDLSPIELEPPEESGEAQETDLEEVTGSMN